MVEKLYPQEGEAGGHAAVNPMLSLLFIESWTSAQE